MKTIPRFEMRSKKVLTSPIMSNFPRTSSGLVSNYRKTTHQYLIHPAIEETYLEIPNEKSSTRFLLLNPILNLPPRILSTSPSLPTHSGRIIILPSSSSRAPIRPIIIIEIPSILIPSSSESCGSFAGIGRESLVVGLWEMR